MSILLTFTPTGAPNTKNVLSGVTVKTSPVYIGEAQYEESIPENSADITIGVFMDGTLNHKDNVKARIAYEKADTSKRLSREVILMKKKFGRPIKKSLKIRITNTLNWFLQ